METTAYRLSGQSRAFDSDRSASHPPTASYIRARAARADLSEDPMPLFLSDPLGAPDPREFAPHELRARTRIVPRLLATGLAISGAAILAALFQSDLHAIVAGGPSGASGGQAMALVNVPINVPIAQQIPLKEPTRVTDTMLASADRQELAAPSMPSREAIASAHQIALQAQSQARAEAPLASQPVSPEPARTLDDDTLAGLMTRARSLISVGDIAAARLLLERAANAKDATAALLLAQSYDPAALGTSNTRSVIADAAAARDWYQRAASLGSTEARQRLAQFSN